MAFRPEWIEPALQPDDGDAGRLHRFAVRRGVAGLGSWLPQWDGRRGARPAPRPAPPDCAAGLRADYERAGLRYLDDIEIPESQTLRSSGRPVVSRYELSLG